MAELVRLSTVKRDEEYAGVTYHIEGELVPVLQVELDAVPVYFEHHVLLWKDPRVEIGTKPLKGAVKRMVAGMQVFVTQAQGPGRIAFSRDGVGHVFPIHLQENKTSDVREHQFLAATEGVDYSFSRVKGAANMLVGGTGFFIDTFSSVEQQGIVWLHGYRNVFEVTLQSGEQIDVEPGGWIYKEQSVRLETITQKLSTGFLAGSGQLFWNRFTGPGKLGLQSMDISAPTSEGNRQAR